MATFYPFQKYIALVAFFLSLFLCPPEVFGQSFKGQEHVFIIESEGCIVPMSNHQLGVKVKGYVGILTSARGLLPCTRFKVYDYKGATVPMVVRSVALNLDLAFLEVAPEVPRNPGEFDHFYGVDYGLELFDSSQQLAVGCQVVRVDSAGLRASRFGASYTPTSVSLQGRSLRELAAMNQDLKDALEQVDAPTMDLPIYMAEIQTGNTRQQAGAVCLNGAPLILSGEVPMLVGMAGGHYGRYERHNHIWVIRAQMLKKGGFTSLKEAASADAVKEKYRKYLAGQGDAVDFFILKNAKQPSMQALAKFRDDEKALREALLRVRDHLRKVAPLGYSSANSAGHVMCGVGWIDLTNRFPVTSPGGTSARYPASIALIQAFKYMYCNRPGIDKEGARDQHLRNVLRSLNKETSSLGPDDVELWYDVELSVTEVRRFAKARLTHYLKRDFLDKVRREAEFASLYNDCMEIPSLLGEIDRWLAELDPHEDGELIKLLRQNRTLFVQRRTAQLSDRYKHVKAQFPVAARALVEIQNDDCLLQTEKSSLIKKLEKDAANELSRNVLLQNMRFGNNLTLAIAHRFVQRAQIDEIAPYQLTVNATDSSCTVVLLVSSGDSLSFRKQRSEREKGRALVTDTISLEPYAYPLGAYMFPGAYALLQEFTNAVDSAYRVRQNEFLFARLIITGTADGISFRSPPYLPEAWVVKPQIIGGGDALNRQLAFARAYAADQVLKQNEWARDIITGIDGIPVSRVGRKFRNVRVELVFERTEP